VNSCRKEGPSAEKNVFSRQFWTRKHFFSVFDNVKTFVPLARTFAPLMRTFTPYKVTPKEVISQEKKLTNFFENKITLSGLVLILSSTNFLRYIQDDHWSEKNYNFDVDGQNYQILRFVQKVYIFIRFLQGWLLALHQISLYEKASRGCFEAQ
jgi:hypothetical protein